MTVILLIKEFCTMKKIYTLAVLAFTLLGFISSASAQDLLTYNLKLGMKNDAQVVIMQNFLMSKGFLGSGNGTGYFGPLTLSAVRTYQGSNGIDTTGFVGPITRASINAALSGATGGTTGNSLVPGCTSTVGYSPLTGVSCASSQSYLPATNTLTVGQVQVSGVSSTSAYLSSTYSAPASSYYTVKFEYSTNPYAFTTGYQSSVGQIILSGQSGSFTASLTNLAQGQTYYVRAVASGGTYGTVASTPVSFVASGSYTPTYQTPTYQNQSTALNGQPFIGTNAAYSITENAAVISGSYDGRGYNTSVYFQYWYGLSGVNSSNPAPAGTGAGSATFNLSNLTSGMTYSYRMVAVNAYGTVYGTTMQFTTLPTTTTNYVYTYTGSSNQGSSCVGVVPTLTGSLDTSSASGTIGSGQNQAPLLSVRLSSNCGTSLNSLSFTAVPSTTLTSLSDFKMYIAGSSTPIPGTFSGGVFTFSTPVAISGGGYTTLILKANTPTHGTGTVQVNLVSAVATSSSGIAGQYSTSVSGNSLSYSYTVIGNTGPTSGSSGTVVTPGPTSGNANFGSY